MFNAQQKHDDKYTVLIVDDEKNIVQSLKRLFRQMGYNTLSAMSGREGLVLLGSQSIDVVVSDMKMPEMDGAQFLEQVARIAPDTVRILLTGYADMESTVRAINKGKIYRYVSKPWNDDDLRMTLQSALEIKKLQHDKDQLLLLSQKQNTQLKELNVSLEVRVKARTVELERTLGELATAHAELKKMYISTIKTFSSLVDTQGGPMQGTNRRIADLAQKLAIQMGAGTEEAQNTLVAGLLYSVGKLGLDHSLLCKPYETFTVSERESYLKYPILSEQSIAGLEPLKVAAKIIRHHLERYDGHGVPDKLADEEIPLGSRILAVIVDFELMRAGLKIEKPMNITHILEYLMKNRSKKYDPVVVDEFINLIKTHVDYVHLF